MPDRLSIRFRAAVDGTRRRSDRVDVARNPLLGRGGVELVERALRARPVAAELRTPRQEGRVARCDREEPTRPANSPIAAAGEGRYIGTPWQSTTSNGVPLRLPASSRSSDTDRSGRAPRRLLPRRSGDLFAHRGIGFDSRDPMSQAANCRAISSWRIPSTRPVPTPGRPPDLTSCALEQPRWAVTRGDGRKHRLVVDIGEGNCAVDIMGLTWVGTRTDRYDETVALFAGVLGLPVLADDSGFTVLGLPDGSTIEVFGPDSPYNRHISRPVPGFRVRDLDTAHDELVAAGVDVVLPIQGGGDRRWLHVKGPDGSLYELVESTGP